MKKPKMRKVIVKVLKDNEVQWVHFSKISASLYKKFLRVTESDPCELNEYLSKWCKEDFEVTLRMYRYSDIYHLKKAIIERYSAVYPELCESPDMGVMVGWVRMWLSQHMKEEIASHGK